MSTLPSQYGGAYLCHLRNLATSVVTARDSEVSGRQMNSKMSHDIGFDIVELFTAPDFIEGEWERFYKVNGFPGCIYYGHAI